MRIKKVGVLGCGGYIGKYATEKLLRLGFCVKGAQRKEPRNIEVNDNFRFISIDVNDKRQLENFIQGCDIVVNCISPSYLYGKTVKDAVCEQNKIYVDPSDMSFENDTESVNGRCVASCGYIPGMAEYFPYILFQKSFDEIERVIEYQGGFDGCSPGAFVDMILGAGSKNLHGDAYILNGKITPLLTNFKRTYKIPFTQENVIFKPVVNRDSVRLQKKIGSREHYFFCTYNSVDTLSFFMKLLMEVARYDKNTAAKNIKRELYEKIMTDKTFGKEEVGAYLFFELSGKKGKNEKTIVGEIFLKNVNRLCGNFLGEVVKQISVNQQQLQEGMNYAFEILNAKYSKKILEELKEDEYIKITEIPTQERIDIQKIL